MGRIIHEQNLERTSNSSKSTRPVEHLSYRRSAFGRITGGSPIAYYSLMFHIASTFKGQKHVFAGRAKIISHSSCRTSAILKYICHLLSIFCMLFCHLWSTVAELVVHKTGDSRVASSSLTAGGELEQDTLSAA